MFVCKSTLLCLTFSLFSSQCAAIYRLRRANAPVRTRKVKQVLYLQEEDMEEQSGTQGINVPLESIPLVSNESRDLSFWSSIIGEFDERL